VVIRILKRVFGCGLQHAAVAAVLSAIALSVMLWPLGKVRWGILQKSDTSPNFATADSDYNSNTLYTVYHDPLKGPVIMANSLKDALT
jgi:hypothetical protein